MAVVLLRRRPMARSLNPFGWFVWGRSVVGRLWARRNLSAQQRANLLASYTPVGVIALVPAGHLDGPCGAAGRTCCTAGRRRVH